MTRLRFNGQAVRELLEHARMAGRHVKPYEPGIDPGAGLLLVKDDGIYLMSNGLPGLSPSDPDAETQNKVVYADGYSPDLPDRRTQYEKIRRAVGGDDFAELIPDGSATAGLSDGDTFIVELTRDTVQILIEPGNGRHA